MWIKVIDCKLQKNEHQWRVNQNTSFWFSQYLYGLEYDDITPNWLKNNISSIRPRIKHQKNTKYIIK